MLRMPVLDSLYKWPNYLINSADIKPNIHFHSLANVAYIFLETNPLNHLLTQTSSLCFNLPNCKNCHNLIPVSYFLVLTKCHIFICASFQNSIFPKVCTLCFAFCIRFREIILLQISYLSYGVSGADKFVVVFID